LALTTTSINKAAGGFFRGVWLLPRMSPSVLYILLWAWAINPSEVGLLNQILMQVLGLGKPLDLMTAAPIALIIFSNGFIGASMGMIIFTAAIRGIPEHLFHAAAVDGAGMLSQIRFITLPALRWPDGASLTWSASCSGRASRFTENGEAGGPHGLSRQAGGCRLEEDGRARPVHAPG